MEFLRIPCYDTDTRKLTKVICIRSCDVVRITVVGEYIELWHRDHCSDDAPLGKKTLRADQWISITTIDITKDVGIDKLYDDVKATEDYMLTTRGCTEGKNIMQMMEEYVAEMKAQEEQSV